MSRRLSLPAGLGAIALGVLALGCVYDAGQRCGPHEALDPASGLCACVPGAVPMEAAHGCVPCAADEVVSGKTCACKPGFQRVAGSAVCQPVPAGLDAPCAPMTSCAAPFAHCQMTSATAGYCTSSGCNTSADCPQGWACDRTAAPSHCRRPPRGQGKACAAAADCAGGDATHCESFMLRMCLVEGCKPGDANACHEGWLCCDVTPLGLPKTLCLPRDVIQDKCP